MTFQKKIIFGGVSSTIGRIVINVLNLILIPTLFGALNKEELGIWFLLAQSTSFVGLMDLGLSPTLTRRIAMSKGSGFKSKKRNSSSVFIPPIEDLIATAKKTYNYLFWIVLIVTILIGFFFFDKLNYENLDKNTVYIAWIFISISNATNVWGSLWSSILRGLGYVGWDAVYDSITKSITILLQLAIALLGGGVIWLAVAGTLGAIALRISMYLFLKSREGELLKQEGEFDRRFLKNMLDPSIKAWVTALGAFIVLKTDQYFIAYFEGSDKIPSYHAAYQLIFNLYFVAVSFASSSSVFVSRLWHSNEIKKIHDLVFKNLRGGLVIFIAGGIYLYFNGQSIIELWLGEGNFVGLPILMIFTVMLFLEAQHVIVAHCSRATEDEAFAGWAMGAGVINLILTYLLIQKYGLMGVALSTLIAQLFTNNWYTLYRGFSRLKISFANYFNRVVVPVFSFGICIWGLLFLLNYVMEDLLFVITSFLLTCTLLGIYLLYSILGYEEIIQYIKVKINNDLD